MKKLLSILLLALFGLPLAAPLLALTSADAADLRLPACCRRNGQHHCSMALAATAPDGSPQTAVLHQTCPYGVASLTVAHLQTLISSRPTSLFTTLAQTRTALPLSPSHGRAPRDPARPQRGPPTS